MSADSPVVRNCLPIPYSVEERTRQDVELRCGRVSVEINKKGRKLCLYLIRIVHYPTMQILQNELPLD